MRTSSSLSVPLLMGTSVASVSWLLSVVLLRIFGCRGTFILDVLELGSQFNLLTCSFDGEQNVSNGSPLHYSCLENPMDGGPW